MRAGLLKEIITIQSSTLFKNSYGEEKETWFDKCTTRARLIHDSGSRQTTNNEIFYSHRKTLQIRPYIKVDDFDKILWNGKEYRVIDIEPNKEQQMQIITIEEIND